MYFSLNFFCCVGILRLLCKLIVLSPTFLPGSRVDDFNCCSSSSTGRRAEDGCLGLVDYKTSRLVVRGGRTDIGIWGRRSRGLRRWRMITGEEY